MRPRKLTDEDVVRIREARAAGERGISIANRYGISESTVSLLVRGKRRLEAGGPIASEYRKRSKTRRMCGQRRV